jgi:multidrug resistance efflux pump
MIRKFVLPLLAVAGVLCAIQVVIMASKPVPAAAPVVEPASAPFRSYIAGAGIIEARTQNVAIGTPVPGIVTRVFVQVGSAVKAAEPLFKLDDRDLQAELAVRRTAVQTVQENLTRLMHLPRQEDIPPAVARVQETEAALADAQNQLARVESVTDRRAISQEDISRRRFAVQGAAARLAAARAQLSLLKAGAWKHDVNIVKAEVAAAQAQVQAVETNLERLTVCAPIDGEILQVNIRQGEFAPAGALQTPLILLGNLERLHVRVDIDENDAWRFQPQAPAVAVARGNQEIQTPLRFERGAIPVYVGQQMDVFIAAPSVESSPVMPDRIAASPPVGRGKP